MPDDFKCKNCNMINFCRYCPSKFEIANGSYYEPIIKYCHIAEKIKNEINKGEKLND